MTNPPEAGKTGADKGVRPAHPPRRLGTGAAARRTEKLRAGAKGLKPYQEALLVVLGRLLVHFDNVSARLYYTGEMREDGEARLAVKKLLDIAAEIRETMRMAGLGDEGIPDIVGRLRGEQDA